jgi:hypothetical protein
MEANARVNVQGMPLEMPQEIVQGIPLERVNVQEMPLEKPQGIPLE